MTITPDKVTDATNTFDIQKKLFSEKQNDYIDDSKTN